MSPVCDNCGAEFPGRMEIDGKVRNLYSRKYCLDCSPFGEHNTSQLHKPGRNGDKCECLDCGRVYEYDRSKGHQLERCNSCCVKRRRKKRKKKLVDMQGGECIKCGYDNCLTALDFHHRNPNEKEFGVTECVTTRTWESLKEEAEKCDLLCSNCHRENHCNDDH